jgi:hypothetical protein
MIRSAGEPQRDVGGHETRREPTPVVVPRPPPAHAPWMGEHPPDALDDVLARAVAARADARLDRCRAAPPAAPRAAPGATSRVAPRAAPSVAPRGGRAGAGGPGGAPAHPPLPPRIEALPARSPADRQALAAAAAGLPRYTEAQPLDRIVALANVGGARPVLKADEVIELARSAVPDSALETLAKAKPGLAAAGRTVAELVQLALLGGAAPTLTPPEAIALARVRVRPMEDLVELAAAKATLPEGRTVAHLAEFADEGADGGARPRLTVRQVVDLLAQVLSIRELQKLTRSALPTRRTIAEIMELRTTVNDGQANALARVDRPMEDLRTIAAAARPALLAGRRFEDLVTLASLGPLGAPRLTAAGVVGLLTARDGPARMAMPALLRLLDHLEGIDGDRVVAVVAALRPLSEADRVALCETLAADELTGTDIDELVSAFHRSSVDGAGIREQWLALRAAYVLDGDDDIVVTGGTRILTGPLLKLRVIDGLRRGVTAVRLPGDLVDDLVHNVTLYPGAAPERTVNQWWTDCDLALTARAIDGRPETREEQKARQRLALNRLLNHPGHELECVRQLFAHEEGRVPRRIEMPDVEDKRADGHTVTRHVLDGEGEIRNPDDVALRALGLIEPGHSPAGAFLTAAGAREGIQGALDVKVATKVAGAGWEAIRADLAKGVSAVFAEMPAVKPVGVKMTKAADIGLATPAMLPPPHEGGSGTRALHGPAPAKRSAAAGGPAAPAAETEAAPLGPLCIRDDAPRYVTVRLRGCNCAGGFAVHSAWPE